MTSIDPSPAPPPDRAEEPAETLRIAIGAILQVFKIEQAIAADSPYARLNMSDLGVVLYLGERGSPAKMTEIASYLDARLSSAGTIVDRLIRDGLAGRERVDADRRVVLVGLTEAGRALHSDVVNTQRRHCAAMLDTLETDEERSALLMLLGKVAAAVSRADQSAK